MTKDPSSRISAEDALKHPWVQNTSNNVNVKIIIIILCKNKQIYILKTTFYILIIFNFINIYKFILIYIHKFIYK